MRRLFFLISLLPFLVGQACSQKPGSFVSDETIEPVNAPFAMPVIHRPQFPSRTADIRTFGAQEGGVVRNTEEIRKAIQSLATEGGGTVLIPEGRWLTGPIHLESNINLHLAKGAELLFSQEKSDYLPVVFSRHEDTECYKYSALVYANGKTNIAITGSGVLNGQGKPWWSFKKERASSEKTLHAMGAQGVPVAERIFDGTGGRELRPAFFQPMSCTNVLVEGVTFLYGPFWTITPTYCENVIVRRVKIVTEGPEGHAPNGDGVDPSSCRNVLIEQCEFNTGDDCIAIKAGRDRDGLRVNRPTENVVVRHCVGLKGHGGIVIGSETAGSIRNIYGHDCRFNGTDRIVRIKTARGRGGVLENMWFASLVADTIEMEAIHLNMLYTGERLPVLPVDSTTPRMRNIHVENVTCGYGKTYAFEILGIPEMNVQDVTFKDIRIAAAKGIHVADANEIRMTGIDVRPERGAVLRLENSHDIVVDSLAVPAGIAPLVEVAGDSKGIVLKHTDIGAAKEGIRRNPGVAASAVEVE